MSVTKEKALAFAIQYAAGRPEPIGIAGIIDYAKGLEMYLEGQAAPVAKAAPAAKTEVLPKSEPSKPLKETKPAKAAKPVKTEDELAAEVRAAQKADEDAMDAAEQAERFADVEEDDVKGAIADMLKANKRKELINLFAKFGAKSFSGLQQKDWGAFYSAASDIIIAS